MTMLRHYIPNALMIVKMNNFINCRLKRPGNAYLVIATTSTGLTHIDLHHYKEHHKIQAQYVQKLFNDSERQRRRARCEKIGERKLVQIPTIVTLPLCMLCVIFLQ